ncbi:MAG: hypothetical protein LBI43_00630 [Streptococcaceae bacterium]|jgi:hypothetical protein|nr:hypothetical protein [Streptococcaceae bacterium]
MSQLKRWVTQLIQYERTDAITKAKSDITTIATSLSYQPLPIFLYDDTEESDEGLAARIEGITGAIATDDILLYQYPSKWYGYRFDRQFIHLMRQKGVQVILFIHDLDSFTGGTGLSWDDEASLLNSASLLISHGSSMTDWLKKNGIHIPIVNLQLFDFLHPLNRPLSKDLKRCVTFAGWLPKAPFLVDYREDVPLDVYGTLGNLTLSKKVYYHGEFSQDELLKVLPRDNFGLSWADNVGIVRHHDYQRLNNPLKVSLYLSLGLPVIVWQEASLAPLVTSFNLGLTISSISEIAPQLESLSDDELYQIKERSNAFSKLLQNGYFTRSALLEAEKILFLGGLN